MSAEYQSELFKEFEKKKKGLERITAKIIQKRKKLYVTLALENVVFAVIVIIMCIVTAFALGVERGKRLNQPVEEKKSVEEKTVTTVVDVPHVSEYSAIKEESPPTTSSQEVHIESKEPPAKPKYTIQLISYRTKKRALKEKAKLANQKIDVFIIKSSSKWYQVCAGNFTNMREANKALKKFKKDYRGCFVRNL